jgi:hypothetical protein
MRAPKAVKRLFSADTAGQDIGNNSKKQRCTPVQKHDDCFCCAQCFVSDIPRMPRFLQDLAEDSMLPGDEHGPEEALEHAPRLRPRKQVIQQPNTQHLLAGEHTHMPFSRH